MEERKRLPSDIYLYLLDARGGIGEAEREALLRFISMEKREQIFNRKLGRDDALLADVLRQYAVWDAFRLSPKEQHIANGEYGKPYLLGNKDIFFNYSHSEGLILCAAARREVGVDIQKIKLYNSRLAKRICSENEMVQLESSDNPAETFCRLWTKKEAAAKLYGTGLFRPHPEEGFFYTETYADYILTLSWL